MAVASRPGTGRAFTTVLPPTPAKGVIVRRPLVVAVAAKLRAGFAARKSSETVV